MRLIKRLIKSFKHALHGLSYTIKTEQNFKIQFIIGAIAICLGIYFKITLLEFGVLTLVILIVLSLEMLNSIIERILDATAPEIHFNARIIKDVMAGAVLTASLGALIIGILIFMPYILGK
jgi:diacylglycerol kinase